jgi:hypothetical protein
MRYIVFILQTGNPDHMRMLKDMGISILTLSDGRVQLLHTFANVSFHVTFFVKQIITEDIQKACVNLKLGSRLRHFMFMI